MWKCTTCTSSCLHYKMKNKSWLLPEQFSSRLVVVHVACIAGSCLVVLFVCVGNTAEWKLWGQRRGRGQNDFLNNYPEVAHSFYFYFTFDWTRLILLYNNKHHFCTIAKTILTVPASHCIVSTWILSSTKCHFSLYKPHLAQFKGNITLYFFLTSASCIPDA